MYRSFSIQILLAFFLTQGPIARAQRPLFGVYLATGTIKCTPARGPSRLISRYDWLYPSDRLSLLDNISQITLFGRDTTYVCLHGKGTYAIDQIKKMQHTCVRDTLLIRYLSLTWAEVIQPVPAASHASTALVLAPRANYATSIDSVKFTWHQVSWARKYFLRLRDPDGQLCYDSTLTDTQAVIYFPRSAGSAGNIRSAGSADNTRSSGSAGNIYTWTLDLVSQSGRLQFADSNHIVLVNESATLPHLPPILPDSIGGIAIILQQIEQYENAGCTKRAAQLLLQLTADFPQDAALDKMYIDFRRRNAL
jgi:hypothetical protein